MRPRPSKLNLPQNLFSVYLREDLCYDEVATSKNFHLDIKTKGSKTEVLEPKSDDANRKSLPRISVNLSLPRIGLFLLEFSPTTSKRVTANRLFSMTGVMACRTSLSQEVKTVPMQENVARLYL